MHPISHVCVYQSMLLSASCINPCTCEGPPGEGFLLPIAEAWVLLAVLLQLRPGPCLPYLQDIITTPWNKPANWVGAEKELIHPLLSLSCAVTRPEPACALYPEGMGTCPPALGMGMTSQGRAA